MKFKHDSFVRIETMEPFLTFIAKMKSLTTFISSGMLFSTVLAMLTIAGCSRKSDVAQGTGEPVLVQVSLGDAVFEETEDVISRANTPYFTSTPLPDIQRSELEIGNDLLLTTELVPQSNAELQEEAKEFAATSGGTRQGAAAEITPVNPNVRYRLVVYNQSGAYVNQREYIRGQENTTPALMLDGDATYTFIAYSFNTTASIPAVATTPLASTNLTITGAQDFMYFRREMTISGNNQNFLEVVLRHRMSQITTIIDASAVAYNVTAVTSNFSSQSPGGVVPLSTGAPSRTGTAANRAVTFSTTGTEVVTSVPTILHVDPATAFNYTVTSIAIGPTTQTNLTPFANLTIAPGVKYRLIIRVVPVQDILLEVAGLPAVRINGQVWMRHNVGADTSIDPDQNPSIEALHGSFFQWGRINVVATTSSPDGALSGWNTSTNIAGDSWRTNPKNVANDPCPPGFRVPTPAEFQSLMNATNHITIGTVDDSQTNFSSARVAMSRRNANARLTLPLAGDRFVSNGSRNARGRAGLYWTSRKATSQSGNRIVLQETGGWTTHESSVAYGCSMRCISE